jgi:hypothetical protein
LAAIEAARIMAAAGESEEAQERLEFAERRVRQLHHVPLEFATRLAKGEMKLLLGSPEEGRNVLRALQQEAGARGFGGIVRNADTLLRAHGG